MGVTHIIWRRTKVSFHGKKRSATWRLGTLTTRIIFLAFFLFKALGCVSFEMDFFFEFNFANSKGEILSEINAANAEIDDRVTQRTTTQIV